MTREAQVTSMLNLSLEGFWTDEGLRTEMEQASLKLITFVDSRQEKNVKLLLRTVETMKVQQFK